MIASFAFWVLQFKIVRPSLEMAPTIAKYAATGREGSVYQVKFRNRSRRDAYDIAVTVHCYVTGLLHEGQQEVMTLEEWHRPVLRGRRWWRVTLHLERMPERAKGNYLRYLPTPIQLRIERDQYVDVEEFLKIRDDTKLVVYLSATDSLSGARAMVSAQLDTGDIRVGPFKWHSFEHTGRFHDEVKQLDDEND